MNTQVSNIEELFSAAGEREPAMRKIDAIVRAELPMYKRELFGGMSGMVLAYGISRIKYASGKEFDWPIIAIAPQKNYISLYVCAVQDGAYIAETYKPKLGKVSVGKSCIRFKSMQDIDLEGMREMLKQVAKLQKSGATIYGV